MYFTTETFIWANMIIAVACLSPKLSDQCFKDASEE